MIDFIIDFIAGLFLLFIGFQVGVLSVNRKVEEAADLLEKILKRNDDDLRRFQEQTRK